MNTFFSAEQEVKAAFLNYIKSYFDQRDLEGTTRLLDEKITGIGTARDELAIGIKECLRLYERDMEQVPGKVEYELSRVHVICPSDDCGVAHALIDIRLVIAKQQVRFNGLRLSTVFHRKNSVWLLMHMHLSLPTTAHGEDESYPVRELEERAEVLQRLVDEKTARLHAALNEIQSLASKDTLTGLCNRLKIDEHLEREINRSHRYLTSLSLILLDVDHFKDVNDTYGHLKGDQVLIALAELMQRRVRKTDILGRWGGEEFLLLCPETGLQDAALLAESLRATVAEHDFGLSGKCTVSLGVTSYAPGDSAESLVGRADKALYAAKYGGRNLVICRATRSSS